MRFRKKYFDTKKEAVKVCQERNEYLFRPTLEVFKMPKGTRHAGKYAVCSYIEYLNTY